MTRMIFSYIHDLTDPNAQGFEMAVLTLEGEEFVSFNWTLDWEALPIDPFTAVMFREFPWTIRHVVEGYSEEGSLVDYLCRVFSHSTFYVSSFESDQPVYGQPEGAPSALVNVTDQSDPTASKNGGHAPSFWMSMWRLLDTTGRLLSHPRPSLTPSEVSERETSNSFQPPESDRSMSM